MDGWMDVKLKGGERKEGTKEGSKERREEERKEGRSMNEWMD